jgi:hypothetical protein
MFNGSFDSIFGGAFDEAFGANSLVNIEYKRYKEQNTSYKLVKLKNGYFAIWNKTTNEKFIDVGLEEVHAKKEFISFSKKVLKY